MQRFVCFRSMLASVVFQLLLVGSATAAQILSGEYVSYDGRKLEFLPNNRWAIGGLGGKYENQGDHIFLDGGKVNLRGKMRVSGKDEEICFGDKDCFYKGPIVLRRVIAEGVLSTSAYKVAIAEQYSSEKRVPKEFDKHMPATSTKWFSTRVNTANEIVVQFGREYSGGKLVVSPTFSANGAVSWKCKGHGIPEDALMTSCK